MKIIFYGNTLRAFRTTLIWYFYEVCQKNECYLVLNEVDEQTRCFLSNKEHFPGLRKIIIHKCILSFDLEVLTFNRNIYKLAKELIYEYKPDVVICSSDWHSLFEMYLLRFAKRKHILRITLEDTLADDVKRIRKYYNLLYNVNYKNLYFLKPLFNLLIKTKVLSKHYFVYWVCPILNFDLPLNGLSSYIRLIGNSGMRDTNMHIVFKENFIDFLNSGTPDYKLLINEHPIKRIGQSIIDCYFQIIYPKELFSNKKNNIVLLLSNIEVGFDINTYSIISNEKKREERIKIIKTVAEKFPTFNIIIKAHPNIKNLAEYQIPIADNIIIIDKDICVEAIIYYAQIIIDLPTPYSTATYFASLLYPQKIVLSIDTLKEFCGDYFKNYDGIEYIDDFEKLTDYLHKIRNDTYEMPIHEKLSPNHSLNEIIDQAQKYQTNTL